MPNLANFHYSKPDENDGDLILSVQVQGVNNGPFGGGEYPSDSDMIDIGNAILATDYMQGMPWMGEDVTMTITTPDTRQVYPTP